MANPVIGISHVIYPVIVANSKTKENILLHNSVFAYSLYAVVVVLQNNLDGTPRQIIQNMNNALPPPYSSMSDIYTAAVWTKPEDVPQVFVVGDESTSRGPNGVEYINERLKEGTQYGVFYYIELESDGVSLTIYMHYFIDVVIGTTRSTDS